MTQHKHTSGPAWVSDNHNMSRPWAIHVEPHNTIVATAWSIVPEDEQRPNADLIAEAFTVAHETGRTPRQLADERAALIEALRALSEFADSVRPGGPVLRGEAEIMDNAAAILARCDADAPEPVAASNITATDRADLAAFVNWAGEEIGAGRHLCDDPSDSEPVQQIERGHEIARRIAGMCQEGAEA